MVISNSELGAKEFLSALTGSNGTLILDFLEELDGRMPARNEAELLKKAYSEVKDPVLAFQIKKSLRLAAFKLKKTELKVSAEGLEKLLHDPQRLDDLALGINTIEAAEAFLVSDYFRQAEWHNFPAPILPNFCIFFKKYGNISDSPALQELTRHPDPTVITAALAALEKIDPENLQGIIIPLLDSPKNVVKAQAIQAFYRWNRGEALKHLVKLLFSSDEQEVILALHHATFFPFPEIESHLIRLLTMGSSASILMRITQIFKANANLDLPFKLFWVNRTLEGQHQSLVKGVLLGVVRALADKKLIDCSIQDYLDQLKDKVKAEEIKLLKETCKITHEEAEESVLPSLEDFEEKGSFAEASPKPSKSADAAKPAITAVKTLETSFENYNNLPEQEKIQQLTRVNQSFFNDNKDHFGELFAAAKGKELAALINLYGKYGKAEDSEKIKKCIKNENPDIICASIRALANLDSEFLCLYLPQFMQDKNGKIRMTATRVFVTIDRERINSLLTSMIASPNIKQRSLAVATSMLVDFNIVRQPLVDALSKETSVEIIEKLGLVLAANPDRELLSTAYKIWKNSKTSLMEEHQKAVESIAEKLAVSLNHISTPQELLKEAESAFLEEQKAANKIAEKQALEKLAQSENNEKTKKEVFEQPLEDSSIQDILTSSSSDPKTRRAKITVIIWLLVAVIWGGAMAMLFLRFILGE